MERNETDWADRLGKQISTVVLVLIAAFLGYGFLGWIVTG